LFLLLFVHSDLIFAYPNIIYPVQWFLLSAFFFISGFLAYNSFRKRGNSIQCFFKSKAKKLYIPFMTATIFYFAVEMAMDAKSSPIGLATQLSMLNIFDRINTVYNWASLWFIPYLLSFMLIVCLLEKYVKTTKIQVLIISVIWLSVILLWVYDAPMRLGELFSQYLLVFAFGFFVNKFQIYDRIMSFKMAVFAIPLVAFFSIDFSGFFNYNNVVEAFKAQLYWNGRSIIFTLGLVLLCLLFLRKIKVPKNGFAKQIASRSVFIYLFEPFISFIIITYGFMEPDSALFAGGIEFYFYLAVRVIVLLLAVPLVLLHGRSFIKKDSLQRLPLLLDDDVLGKTF
jgi:fucose 4-O-acetylase-like acetyltransferase